VNQSVLLAFGQAQSHFPQIAIACGGESTGIPDLFGWHDRCSAALDQLWEGIVHAREGRFEDC
jgi:hypothetical protein